MSQDLSSRKRGRNNCEEECCDFMPLSKRINNLHINGTIYTTCEQHSEHGIFKQDGTVEEWSSLQSMKDERLQPTHSLDPTCAADKNSNNDFHVVGGNFIENNCTTLSSSNQEYPWMSEHVLSQYAPSLTASDNPYYYENNKLLFALYMERLQRGGIPLY